MNKSAKSSNQQKQIYDVRLPAMDSYQNENVEDEPKGTWRAFRSEPTGIQLQAQERFVYLLRNYCNSEKSSSNGF